MERKFKETSIAEDFSKALAKQCMLLGPSTVPYIATVLFHGTSSALGAVKNTTVPKAVVFRSLDHTFLAAAKVEYIANDDDPTNPAAGRWDYTWTFYEDDIKGADVIDVATNSLMTTYYTTSGANLYNMKFQSQETCIMMMIMMIEMIIAFLKDNVTEDEPVTLTLDEVFKASASIVDGKIEMGIVPDGAMKVLIKDDSVIQEA